MKTVDEISYKETLEDTHNPYRGFYQAFVVSYKRNKSNCKAQASTLEELDELASEYHLIHLLIDLSDFQHRTERGRML